MVNIRAENTRSKAKVRLAEEQVLALKGEIKGREAKITEKDVEIQALRAQI